MALRGLLKNWPYKLLALGAAIILTTYVHGERNPWVSTTMDLRLDPGKPQKGYVVTSLSQDTVTISLEGLKADVDGVKPSEVRAWIDVPKLQTGTYSLPVRVSLPQALERKVAARPTVPNVSATIEELSSRVLPIEARIKTSPPIGYAPGEPSITPSTVTVSGGSSVVERIARLVVIVDPTPLRPSVDDYVAIKALDARNEEIKGVEITPEGARVVLELVEAPASKSVFVSPTIVGQPQFPYRVAKVSVAPSSVTIKGKPEILVGTSLISTDDLDITGAVADVVRYVALQVPPGLQIEGPGSVKVTVKVVPGPRT